MIIDCLSSTIILIVLTIIPSFIICEGKVIVYLSKLSTRPVQNPLK